MRKSLGNIVVVLMVLGGMSLLGATAALSQEQIDLNDQAGGLGASVTFTVSINSAPNDVDAMGFDVRFNPAILQYAGTFTEGDLVDTWDFFDVSNPTSGVIRVGGFTTRDAIVAGGSGTVVLLNFTVIGAADTTLTFADPVDDIRTWTNGTGQFTFVPNIPPVARDDTATTSVDTPVTIAVLANDTDEDGTLNPATVTIMSGPAAGAATPNPDGTVTYTPNRDFAGTDSFTYTVKDDDNAPSNAATVTITVRSLSICIWGLYLDNSSAIPREWESRLFISNIDTVPRNFDVTVFANNRRVVTLVPLVPPDAVRSFTCTELGACNNFGWLLVTSDAPFMAATLFVINNLFGQGSFTAQTGFCF